jgi:nucleoside-specific outer membrane channel protein Tsx
MRKTISAAALLLALTCTAYAGDMQNDSPKPPANTVQETAVDGDIQNDVAGSLTQMALELLAALPSLF